ncbi:MAG: GNAT family N-acetyltransferase [Bacilli bacterium]|nr:GNAT family N-acetyltransferase [Bacilli bacterium]
MKYNIRLAIKEDVKNLSKLKQLVWDETYRGIYDDDIIDNFDYTKSENSFQGIIDNASISLYVVESEDELVGYMSVGVPVRKFADYNQEIGLLYLRKDFQHQGIGRKLFNMGYNEIKNNGYANFFISCNKYNMKAREFYEKMGGKLIHEDEDIGNKRYIQAKYHYDIKGNR